jgi:hypothetical protein
MNSFEYLYFILDVIYLIYVIFILFCLTAFHTNKLIVVNKAIKSLENEKHREFYREIMIKATNQTESEWTQNRRKRVAQTENEFQWERKKLTQKMILEMEHDRSRSVDLKSVNEQREKEEEKQVFMNLKEEAKHEQQWEETRDVRVSSWRDWQSTGSATKKRKLGLLKPPKVPLVDAGVVVKKKSEPLTVVEEKIKL